MHYWAKNGSWNQICDTSEYAGKTTGMETVKMTYKATNFWNNYDGTKSPVSGNTTESIAKGW